MGTCTERTPTGKQATRSVSKSCRSSGGDEEDDGARGQGAGCKGKNKKLALSPLFPPKERELNKMQNLHLVSSFPL